MKLYDQGCSQEKIYRVVDAYSGVCSSKPSAKLVSWARLFTLRDSHGSRRVNNLARETTAKQGSLPMKNLKIIIILLINSGVKT